MAQRPVPETEPGFVPAGSTLPIARRPDPLRSGSPGPSCSPAPTAPGLEKTRSQAIRSAAKTPANTGRDSKACSPARELPAPGLNHLISTPATPLQIPGTEAPTPHTPDAPRAKCGTGPTPPASRAETGEKGQGPRKKPGARVLRRTPTGTPTFAPFPPASPASRSESTAPRQANRPLPSPAAARSFEFGAFPDQSGPPPAKPAAPPASRMPAESAREGSAPPPPPIKAIPCGPPPHPGAVSTPGPRSRASSSRSSRPRGASGGSGRTPTLPPRNPPGPPPTSKPQIDEPPRPCRSLPRTCAVPD